MRCARVTAVRLAGTFLAAMTLVALHGCADRTQFEVSGVRQVETLVAREIHVRLLIGYGPDFDDECVQLLPELERLDGVWLRGCPSITGAGLSSLSDCEDLHDACFWNIPALTGEHLAELAAGSLLEELIVVKCAGVSAQDIAWVRERYPNLAVTWDGD